MMRIPSQLHNLEFRFYLIKQNSKLPYETQWNTTNNYMFFEDKLLKHRGNYGVCTGYGNLVILDFDSREYYNSVKDKLPKTFTVESAGKRLPHLYYILKGNMFRKVGIDINGQRVCDVQALRSGIVGPNSIIERRYYNVINNVPLVEITEDKLTNILKFSPNRKMIFNGDTKPQPELIQKANKKLTELNIPYKGKNKYQCPFHPMSGGGNLVVLDTGRIYCFHEQKCWHTIDQFEKELMKYRNS